MIKVGHKSYCLGEVLGEHSDVIIGKYCSIAKGVIFDGGIQHNPRFLTTYPFDSFTDAKPQYQYKTKGNIVIGNDVWIGQNAMILSGVEIADGVIIAAGAVVTKSITEPYTIYGGVPAKFLKFRFIQETINKLLQVKWWDKSDEWVSNNVNILLSENINELVKRV
jgi:chloramphenicol O-acetyltransferase type B